MKPATRVRRARAGVGRIGRIRALPPDVERG
jgi:hypothetical protein